MVDLTPGVGTTRHLREGPGITFLVLGRTFGLQHSTEWNSYLQNELKDEGAGSLVHITGSKSASVRLKLRNEWYHYPLVKISNSRWQGKSKSGCQITFSW